MKNWRHLGCALLGLAVLTGAHAQHDGIALVGADVLTMTGSGMLHDQVVLLKGERITSVEARSGAAVPPSYRSIDARGTVVMPGLVDMHVHLANEPGQPGDAAQRALAVMLAHGVTTVRSMAGAPRHIALRAAVEEGRIPGPRIYAATVPLNDANTPSAEAARRRIVEGRQAGFDLVKSHHLTDLATWEAVQDEARRQGLAVAGHVTSEVGLARALAAHEEIEHLDGALAELLPAEQRSGFEQVPGPDVLRTLASLPDAAYAALARRTAATRLFQTPTLAIFERLADVTTPTAELAAAREMRYVPEPVLNQWVGQREAFVQSGFGADDGMRLRDVRRRLVRAFNDAGVPLMAGSDTAQSFLLWGPGLVEEMRALSASGLGAMGALRAATVVPRDYLRSLPGRGSALGWKADFGTVEAGTRADLVVVDANPVDELRTLLRPRLVIAGGRVYDREQLDTLLAQAARDARPPAGPPPCADGLPADARCGAVQVPEDRADPRSRRIAVRYAVVPARDGPATHDPLVVLPGGPGLGGVQSAAGVRALFAAQNRNRDLLLIDQRGTGGSNRLDCPKGVADDPLAGIGAVSIDEVKRCRDGLAAKADLRLYATREATLDMEEVRATLGYARLDLFGMSYGSRLALDYLRLYPERVGHTVIRAAAPPSMKLPLYMPRDAQHAFDVLAAACREQPACRGRHPRLEVDLQRILARLDAGPVPVTVTDPAKRAPMAARLDRASFATLLFFMLYVPELYVQLPPLLEQAAAGDFQPLVQAAAPLLFGLDDQVAAGLRWSVVCTEDVTEIDPAEIGPLTAGTFSGRAVVDREREACGAWPAARVPADYLLPVRSQAPVLIISGTMDPIAGEPWAERIAQTLPRSRRVVVTGASHLPPLPGCTSDLVERFLDGEALASMDLGCIAESRMRPLRY